MEKKTFEQAKNEVEVRSHNSNMENLANAARYVAEKRDELNAQLAALAELDARIEAAGAETPVNPVTVRALYSEACKGRFG